ncbi:hypothetical protein [Lysobacter sp. CA196]|uniref:hypothetical protein n=1 Tax=Lysobacter sp. CA196 TaxID=3455606 RepID=UPI003F8D4BDA
MNQARTVAAALVLALAGCNAPDAGKADPAAPAATATPAPAEPTQPATTPAPPAAAVQLPTEACVKTEDGFAAFFEQFVYEANVRSAYSAPQIEIRDLKDPGKLLESQTPQQAGPFKIALVDNQWSYDEPGKQAGQLDRVKIDRTLSGDRMRVDFVKAEFSPDEEVVKTLGKPEAYVFEFKQGCWQLTQQLR